MVDIIIPAYNNPEGLFKALSSVAAQTKAKKCIVTVVDDCSTKDLKSVCEVFKPYLKIQYIKNKENLRYPGLVRQVGIDHTNAPYIMFLDNDDMLAPEAVEMAQKGMQESNADVIIGFFMAEDANGFFKLMDASQTTWLHGNVYKREYLNKWGIRFPNGYNEDGGFNTQCYLLSDKISVINRPMYYWMFNHESLTRETGNEGMFSVKHCDDIILTLAAAYTNIFNQIVPQQKQIQNLGKHLALFHSLLSTFERVSDEKEKEEYYNIAWTSLLQFCDILHLKQMVENPTLLAWLKNGFVEGYMQYKKDNNKISANEYFSKYLDLNVEITIEDFAKR